MPSARRALDRSKLDNIYHKRVHVVSPSIDDGGAEKEMTDRGRIQRVGGVHGCFSIVIVIFTVASIFRSGNAQLSAINKWCSIDGHSASQSCNPATSCQVRGASLQQLSHGVAHRPDKILGAPLSILMTFMLPCMPPLSDYG